MKNSETVTIRTINFPHKSRHYKLTLPEAVELPKVFAEESSSDIILAVASILTAGGSIKEVEDADNFIENTQTETYNMNVNDLEFIMTCGACPEQYDVFYDKKQVAYVRLRWGYLTVSCPDYGGTCVYESNAGVDSWAGCFKDDAEREEHMKKIRQAIVDYYNENEVEE